ncbi:MAG TPA: M67 family metallopeptidase [Candidatus Acidoferrales bacterium]|nr:M67 family metallopeptidase [Candidatus Acidoferrales bacterium]
MLRFGEELLERIRAHAVQSYPYECCGALLGADESGGRQIRDLVPLDNQRHDSARNRFLVNPGDVRRVEAAARERGLEVVGWYHSHPDAPERPSDFDREHAWPWYSYVIVSVEAAEPRRMAAWRLAEDRARFEPEEIVTEWSASG